MRWQRIARFAIALFILFFVVWLVRAMRRPGSVVAGPETLTIDTKPIAQTVGGADWQRRDKAGKVQFSITSETQKVYEDGRNVFEKATLELPDRDGRTIKITADEAEASKPAGAATDLTEGDFVVRGNVRLQTSDDLVVHCNDASYKAQVGLLDVPGPVTFTRGRLTGSGVGATYDRDRDVLWLLAEARLSVKPDPSGGGALEATAGTAGLARADHYIRLAKTAHVVGDNRTIDADDLTVNLTSDDQKIKTMQLRGHSRMVGTGANAQSMAAHDIDLSYAPDGRTLQHAKLMEQSALQLPASGGDRRITARMIDMTMAPDGTAIALLNATANVVLELPAQGMLPAKTIKSSALLASGEGNAGLQTATFEGPVDYRETRAARGGAAALDRHATARRLVVLTKPGLGDIQQAEFRGNFTFSDGARTTADAQMAVYQIEQDRLDLSVSADPGPPPTVVNDALTVHARTIAITISTQAVTAETDVRSNIDRKPGAPARGGGRGPEAARLPSLLKQDQPVTIRSNRLEYDGVASRAVYSGAARLTQPGGMELVADTIELDDKSGNLTAHLKVQTRMMLEDVDPKTKRRTTSVTTGSAETFVYDEAKRVASYMSPNAPLAHIVGPQGDVTAKQIDLFLKPGTNELERAEADGDVTTIEGNRTARGRHLTYTAEDGKYVMVGTPVEVVEKEEGSCKKQVASTIRFYRTVDSIEHEGSPATTTTVPCPGTIP